MGRIARRLKVLEERARPWDTREQLRLDRALARMETEDLHVLTRYLKRGGNEYATPTEDEAAALRRLEEHLNSE